MKIQAFFGRFLRMKQTLIFFFLVILSLSAGGCGTSNPVVASVGNEKITLEEFENSYAKNNGGWSTSATSSAKDRERFLDLLVKFRLKVQEAKNQGLLSDSSVLEELNSYRVSVAQSYMLEKEIIAPGVQQMYQHRLEEMQAAHILIRLPQNPKPSDTLVAYNKAMKAIALIATLGFDSTASAMSEDAQTAHTGGFIGWVAPGRVYPEIEDALYSLREGEYTKVPARSPLGYHIIKNLKRQPASGAIHISHILKLFSKDKKDTVAVRDTVWQLYNRLRHREDFARIAEANSDDPASKQRGGDIGFYDRDRLRPDVVSLLFDLPTDSIPLPYWQPYGYHIFKVTGHRAVAPFSEMEKDLRTDYQQKLYQRDLADYVKRLKKLYNLSVNQAVKDNLRTSFDTTKTPNDSAWSAHLSPVLLNETLFTCAGKAFSVQAFVDSVGTEPEFRGTLLKPTNIDGMIDRLTESEALLEHALTAPGRYAELKGLMDDYLDGILLYRIEQDEVWKKVVVNDSLLRAFYDTTKDHYRWPNRVNFAEIFVVSDSAKRAASLKLSQGQDFLSVAEEFTARPGYRDKLGIWGFQVYNLNELTQKASGMKVDSVSEFFQDQNGWSIIKVIGKDSARTKSFEEAGPELASAYQEQASKTREEQWLDSLKERYGVTVHAGLLMQAFQRKPVEKK